MSEAISGLVQQTLQQTLENQSIKQESPTTKTKPSFEQEMQKTRKVETQDQVKTSGVQIQEKLDRLQSELSRQYKSQNSEKIKPNEMPKELLESKSRLGLLREAYSKMGETSVGGGFGEHLMRLESENKAIEGIMKSDKNLSPGELLALQARLYKVSQHIEVTSKVVDQMAGGIKTVLNTNL